jgi:hypothetical protein
MARGMARWQAERHGYPPRLHSQRQQHTCQAWYRRQFDQGQVDRIGR